MFRRGLLCFLLACSSAPVSTTHSAIIKGTLSDDTQDEVVLMAILDNGFEACSGTLLAANLVLTARHCVSSTQNVPFACDIKGNLINYSGQQIGADHPPNTLLFFYGSQRPDVMSGKVMVAGRGAQIFHDDSKVLCSHDLALVVLDRDIQDPKIVPIRLDDPLNAGDTFTAIGWGATELTPSPQQRQQRTNVKILAVGPNGTGQATPPNDFKCGESICAGDSGGPAEDSNTGAVIGVTSRGGNGMTVDPNNPGSGCTNATNFYTSTPPFKDLILQAFAAAGKEPWLENGPDPRLAKFGEPCMTGADCRSNICQKNACSQDCSMSACPMGYDCSNNICTPHVNPPPPPPPKSGCAIAEATQDPAENSWFGIVAGAIAIALARRRRDTVSM